MKITKKILEKIIKEEIKAVIYEQQAVMTPGGSGGGPSNKTMRIIKKALDRIGEVVNPLMNIVDIATHIQYDDFAELVGDGGREPYVGGTGGMEVSSDVLKREVLEFLKENKKTTSLIYMTIYDMDPDLLKVYISEIAGNA
tara:strand:+ start:568 stop:990 length:423 start_codon:yes stop_codon:yes gene_type:complete